MKASILIVDDEEDVGELFKRRFRKEIKSGAYRFHTAHSGQQALDMLKSEIEPELLLILSDINMPGMSGLELLANVKAILPKLPVVMITAYGDEENRTRAKDLGATAFLTKPIDFVELKDQIQSLTTMAKD